MGAAPERTSRRVTGVMPGRLDWSAGVVGRRVVWQASLHGWTRAHGKGEEHEREENTDCGYAENMTPVKK